MNGILGRLGIDPFYLFIVVFILLIALIVEFALLYLKYDRLQKSYTVFMQGKNGQDLEKRFFRKFRELKEIRELAEENEENIKRIYKLMERHYQKVGIVKYDAFHEMGGNLSFVLTMLDENNNGWILNAMHSREGCYTYIKEIVKGQSYIELAEEESKCLDKAIYQENIDLKDMKRVKRI